MSDHVVRILRDNPAIKPELIVHQTFPRDRFWYEVVSDPRLLDIAQMFIGPDIALFASAYISKPPRDGRPVLWHQDGSYWPLRPMTVVSLRVAVDDADAENGCMRVIPRTHHTQLDQLVMRHDVDNVLSSSMASSVDESQAVDVDLHAGDVSVHHPNIIHGSNANTSARRRCGLTIRYIPTSTKIEAKGSSFEPQLDAAGRWPSAFLMRGAAVPGVNDYNPPPI